MDLLPDIQQPTITVRVNYPGVGPLEMEELITRPLEQALSATAGLEQINSNSQEGNSNLRLNFSWGIDLNEAMNDMRTRIDRVRGRLPEDAEPPTIFKFDSNSAPIMGLGVEGDYDRVTLREMAENILSPRLERVPGVASVTVNGGLRRQIHVELSKEKIQALDLSVDRVVNILQDREPEHPARRDLPRRHDLSGPQPGPVLRPRSDSRSRRPDEGRRAGLSEGHRRGEGLDRGRAIGAADQRHARPSG